MTFMKVSLQWLTRSTSCVQLHEHVVTIDAADALEMLEGSPCVPKQWPAVHYSPITLDDPTSETPQRDWFLTGCEVSTM